MLSATFWLAFSLLAFILREFQTEALPSGVWNRKIGGVRDKMDNSSDTGLHTPRKWWNWQTHHLEGVAPKGMRVQVPPSAPLRQVAGSKKGSTKASMVIL